ncbi:MAG: phosphatidylglycerophosphatase A [candidate division Zixibacteria bacterium]|nr:phosphatidylglycerophosphatase A [candidate division Zixibacteria bacterium]
MKQNQLAKLISTFFYAGYFPVAPGTFGSLVTLAIIWFLIPTFFYILLPISIGLFFLSVWSASRAEDFFGKDGSPIVIDEVTGMAISLIFVSKDIKSFAGAFLLFRLFDIVKLPPARTVERFRGGWGATLDDVIAAVYANLSLHLISYFVNWR